MEHKKVGFNQQNQQFDLLLENATCTLQSGGVWCFAKYHSVSISYHAISLI